MLELEQEMTFAERIEGPLGPTVGAPALILMRYDVALIRGDGGFSRALAAVAETGFGDQYMCMVPQFEVGDDAYAWLTQSLFIARGRLAGPGRIEYEAYRVA